MPVEHSSEVEEAASGSASADFPLTFKSFADYAEDGVVSSVAVLSLIAIAAGLFYTGHQIKQLLLPANKIAKSLEEINQKAGEIIQVIEKFQPIILELLKDINHLLERIQGIIDAQSLDEALSEVRTASDYLRTYMRDDDSLKMAVSNGSMEHALFSLMQANDKVMRKGGYTGFSLSSPGMAIWTRAFAAQEKARYEIADARGEEYEMLSPYKHESHRSSARKIRFFFSEAEKIGAEMEASAPDDPYFLEIGASYSAAGGRAVKKDMTKEACPEVTFICLRFSPKWEDSSGASSPKAIRWFFQTWGTRKTDGRWEWALRTEHPARSVPPELRPYTNFMNKYAQHLWVRDEVGKVKAEVLLALKDPDEVHSLAMESPRKRDAAGVTTRSSAKQRKVDKESAQAAVGSSSTSASSAVFSASPAVEQNSGMPEQVAAASK